MERLQLVWFEPYDVKVKRLEIILMTERVRVPFVSLMRSRKVWKDLLVQKGSMHRVRDVMRDLVSFVEIICWYVNIMLL